MTGPELRVKLKETRFKINEVADLLNISPQNLNNKLNNANVSSTLLEEISKAINVPISWFYGEIPTDKKVNELIKEIEYYKTIILNMSQKKGK
jgi:transcriptional regulator with XRE-family HTH domain